MLTIMAGFAEEESLSVSENIKWRVKKNFEEGKPWSWRLFGYRHENGKFVIVPDEAEIVRRIYHDYLSGSGSVKIADSLNREGLYGRDGHPWQYTNVLRILKNYNYTGNLILQKTFSEIHLTKRRIENEGQLPNSSRDSARHEGADTAGGQWLFPCHPPPYIGRGEAAVLQLLPPGYGRNCIPQSSALRISRLRICRPLSRP